MPPPRTPKRRLTAALCAACLALFAIASGLREREALADDEGSSPNDRWEQAARKIEVGPWLGWSAGWQWRGRAEEGAASLNVGLDVTAPFKLFGSASQYGGRYELRAGSWGAFDALAGGTGAGEGGIVMLFTQTVHAPFGTFGLRVGAGHGGDRESYFTATFTGGVRYVPDRAYSDPGLFSTATGVRIVATVRRTFEPYDSDSLLLGVEFEPNFFLPPYSLLKWGGHH